MEQLKDIKDKLEKEPYKISNTHFKVGAKLHSEDFYYAKPLFQSSSDIKEIAEIIVAKIKEKFKIKKDEKILLIGYEMYSELLLSLVCRLLDKEGYNDINHFVGIDNEGVFSFKPNEKEDMFLLNGKGLLYKCKAIIIVPIASTGSTAVKIKEAVIKEAEKVVKPKLKEKYSDDALKKAIEKQSKLIKFSYDNDTKDYVINVIAAQDCENPETKHLIEKNNSKQEHLIDLPAKWHLSEKCKLCGLEDTGFSESEPLFGTDKSYLTPALIFDYPKGKIIKDRDKDKVRINKERFEKINFNNSLKYRRIKRNNEFFVFSINSPQFIKDNKPKIETWLKNLHKEFYIIGIGSKKVKINDSDKIIILAPCHETNSEFLNLVNEHVFNSDATIIYHQLNVDYIENFKKLYGETLNDDVKEDGTVKSVKKVFYVDDNLISGNSFYDIYHLFHDTVEEKKNENGEILKKELTGAILLRDSSTQEMHDRFLRAVKQCRAFVAYNLPPSLSFDNKKPLEHERKRFADLRQFALHDVLIKIFDEKEQELNVDRDKGDKKRRREHIEITPEEQKKYNEEKEKHDKEKKSHYINMFKTTHKVFDYFKENENEIKKEDKFSVHNLLKDYKDKNDDTENKITLLKVLSQYPSILYKPIKEQAFKWHKGWLTNKFLNGNKRKSLYGNFSYKNFCELKFLIRRAVYLENLQILDTNFLELISRIFNFIKDKQNGSQKSNYFEEENYKDFPVFLVRSYLELAHKNGWAAIKLLKNIDEIERTYFKTDNDDAQRFLRMVKIELAAVVNEFYDMLILQYDREWRDVYRDDNENFNEDADGIKNFFDEKKNKGHYDKLILSNKYDISKQVLKIDNQIENSQSPFINFLWIKQLIHADTHPKSHFPKDVGYQDKINAIIKKMQDFFPEEEKVQAFFVVTDGRQNPYVLSESKLHGFEEEYQTYKSEVEECEKAIKSLEKEKSNTQRKIELTQKENELKRIKEQLDNEKYRYSEIIKFLNGIDDNNRIAKETTAEFKFNKENGIWTDCYNSKNNDIKLNFLDKDKTNWLYLIRLSELEDGEFRTLGLLGFYNKKDLFNKSEALLPKQLLMLLRQDMGKFIKKHHKNDEFALLVKQIEKDKYSFLLNHGTQTYKNTINANLEDVSDEELRKRLYALFDYLLIKLNLLANVNLENQKTESISLTKIKEELEKYGFVFSVKSSIRGKIELNDMDELVHVTFNGFDNLNNKYEFPEKSYKDVIFELLFNIRKHAIASNTFTKEKQLVIDISIENRGASNFLIISNNYFGQLEEKNSDKSKPHGIDLIKEMWKKYELGTIEVEKPSTDNNNFKILIPLKITNNGKAK